MEFRQALLLHICELPGTFLKIKGPATHLSLDAIDSCGCKVATGLGDSLLYCLLLQKVQLLQLSSVC